MNDSSIISDKDMIHLFEVIELSLLQWTSIFKIHAYHINSHIDNFAFILSVNEKKIFVDLNFFRFDVKVGSLAALHMGKRGHNVTVYEYREGIENKIILVFKKWN